MRASMDQLKRAAEIVKKEYNINQSDACRVVGSFHCDLAEIEKILSGDLSSVPAAAASVGVHNSPVTVSNDINNNASNIKPVKRSKSKSAIIHNKDDIKADSKPVTASNNIIGSHSAAGASDVIQAEIIPANNIPNIDGDILPADGLPLGFSETVRGWLHDYASQYNIDLEKCASIQWRSLCLCIGKKIQASGVLRDHIREKTHGGKLYNPDAVAALVDIWEAITGLYKHIPLVVDFLAFSGVSRQWFADYQARGLTSSRVNLAKKVRDIEEAALSAALCDSRENPTGRIYYSKARLGWQENTIITHVSAAAAPAVSTLPVFDGSAGLLVDNTQ